MEKNPKSKTFGRLRGRGVFLTIMAIPLFVTVYFLIFLDLDIISEQSRPGGTPPLYGTHTGRSFLKTIVKMQRALDDLGYDLSKVIGHRDHIRVRVKMILSELKVKVDDELILDELRSVLDQGYFTNFTSVVHQQLLITCNQIDAIQQLAKPKWRNSYSYTEDGLYGFQQVRTVRARTDLRSCPAYPKDTSKFCRLYSNHFATREILILQQLQHPSVAKLIGYCLQDLPAGVYYVIEGGKSVNMEELVAAPWETRLQVLWQLTDLVHFMLSSPMGLVHLASISHHAFYLTPASSIQLWDVSNAGTGEKQCRTNDDCYINGSSHDLKCIKGQCDGFYSLKMLHDARSSFFEPLLRSTPTSSKSTVKRLLKMMQSGRTSWRAIQNILYKLGARAERPESNQSMRKEPEGPFQPEPTKPQVWYTGQDSYSYKKVADTDLPGRFDYACPRSQVTWGCLVAMPTEDSAFRRCSGDPQCRAFVILSNFTNSGWLNVCFKTGYNELVDSTDCTLYIKVPLKGKDEDLRLSHGDPIDGDVEEEPEELQSCLKDVIKGQEEVRAQRERHLMAILGAEGLTEDLWMQSISSATMTSVNMADSRRGLHTSGAGGSVVLHMGAARVKAVRLVTREGPTMYHHAHLMFYHLDRLLGVYLTPPSKQHVFAKEELSFLGDHLPEFKVLFSPLVRQESLTGVLTMLPPHGVTSLDQLEISALSNITHELVPLSAQQRNHLEYVLMLWLSGTPRHVADMDKIKGVLLHVDATDAFKQGVDTLLPYLYHCQFPRHTIKVLLSLEQQSEPSCSLGNQVLYSLQQLGVSSSDLHLHFKSTQQVVLLLKRTSEKLLDICKMCIKRFGEDDVLYD